MFHRMHRMIDLKSWIPNFLLEKDFVGFDEKGNRVLFMTSAADVEDVVTIDKSLLKK